MEKHSATNADPEVGATDIFLTGATGYLGTRLIPRLLSRGHRVTALVRPGSEHKLPQGVRIVSADPLKAETFQEFVPAGCVFVQLLGIRKPSPKKAAQFRQIDLPSLKTSADAAVRAKVKRFVYLSVAQEPTKIMEAYQQVRAEGERYCLEKGLPCVFLRPWYIVGPGHWWPLLLLPFYRLARLFPVSRRKAKALGLNTLPQLLRALTAAVECTLEQNPLVWEVDDLRKFSGAAWK